MIKEGYQVRSMVSWHSETTLETHCLPIFESDALEDVINRYADYFPKELNGSLEEAEEMRSSLYNQDGMSKAKTIMTSFKIPLGLYKLLDAWSSDFWQIENGTFKNKRLINQFLSLMPKLRTHSENTKANSIVIA